MKTSIHISPDGLEVHSPHFWETAPAPIPTPVVCIGSLFLGAVLTLLLLA